MLATILSDLDGKENTVIDIQQRLVSIPAIGPDNGGTGEREKADYLKECLTALAITNVKELNAPDVRVPCGHSRIWRLSFLGRIQRVPFGLFPIWMSFHLGMKDCGARSHSNLSSNKIVYPEEGLWTITKDL